MAAQIQNVYGNEKQIRRQFIIRQTYVFSMLIFFAIIVIIPFYWMILTAFKTEAQVFTSPPI
jgi:ABC-type glycerol-3-phosphate transport system permease component